MGYVECKWEKVNRTTFIRQLLSYSFDGVKASWILPLSIQCRGKRMGSISDKLTLREPWRFRWSIHKIGRKTCIWAKNFLDIFFKKAWSNSRRLLRKNSREGWRGKRRCKDKEEKRKKGEERVKGGGRGRMVCHSQALPSPPSTLVHPTPALKD